MIFNAFIYRHLTVFSFLRIWRATVSILIHVQSKNILEIPDICPFINLLCRFG